jgi:hypothetical protein
MRLHRFLVAVALCAATTGCSSVAPDWLNPDAAPSEAAQEGDPVPEDPPPTRRNSLEMTADTVYFQEGILPMQADGTTAALEGALFLRGQCHDGSMSVKVISPVGPKTTAVTCDGKPHERSLGKLELGDPLSIEATGAKGTDFAIELVVKP